MQLKRAIELDPNDEVAWYRLARALLLTGDQQGQKKALAEFQRLHALEDRHLARMGILSEAGEVTRQKLGDHPAIDDDHNSSDYTNLNASLRGERL